MVCDNFGGMGVAFVKKLYHLYSWASCFLNMYRLVKEGQNFLETSKKWSWQTSLLLFPGGTQHTMGNMRVRQEAT